MALLLADWDLKGALPTLKDRVARCAALVLTEKGDTSCHDQLSVPIAQMTLLRVKGGDNAALNAHGAWLRALTPSSFSRVPVALFEPLWIYPDHPALAEAAVALFDNPKSPWVPLIRPVERRWSQTGKSEMMTSPRSAWPPFASSCSRVWPTAVSIPRRTCDATRTADWRSRSVRAGRCSMSRAATIHSGPSRALRSSCGWVISTLGSFRGSKRCLGSGGIGRKRSAMS
jgi:hypothetical protein